MNPSFDETTILYSTGPYSGDFKARNGTPMHSGDFLIAYLNFVSPLRRTRLGISARPDDACILTLKKRAK